MKKKTRKKVLSTFITIAIIIFLAWFVLSWLEVCIKNTNPNPVYTDWNALKILVDYATNK